MRNHNNNNIRSRAKRKKKCDNYLKSGRRSTVLQVTAVVLQNALHCSLDVGKLVMTAAFQGQTLAIITLILGVHATAHVQLFGWTLFTFSDCTSSITKHFGNNTRTITMSSIMLVLNVTLLSCGYILLVALYRHSVTTIFNRAIPSTIVKCIPSFQVHMNLLRPLEIIFRLVTAPFRVLPDIIVLGEVRCGTTTLCHHLHQSLPGCHTPFCLWKHPELDKKETFYFVGHYLGFVSPHYYSMCFPLKFTKWFHQTILRRPFFTFDGCSQYLTSPTAPYLIAKAYSDAQQRPPILVVSVRNPVDQAISWWKYETNAILWAETMGLTEWNTKLRSSSYPPSSLNDSINFSLSQETEMSYNLAEQLFQGINNNYENSTNNTSSTSSTSYFLPPWAMTWPSGQLSTFGRSGQYTTNIRRYEKVFQEVFGGKGEIPSQLKLPSATSKFQYVNVVPFEYLQTMMNVGVVLDCINQQLLARRFPCKQMGNTTIQQPTIVHRNPSIIKLPPALEATVADKQRLKNLFSQDNDELEQLCGIRY